MKQHTTQHKMEHFLIELFSFTSVGLILAYVLLAWSEWL